MSELFHHSFSLVNLLPTSVLLFCALYWVTVIIGAVDVSSLDVDIDLDLDVDADADFDADADNGRVPEMQGDMQGNPEADLTWMNRILIFLNISKVPLMVWLSVFALICWFGSVNITDFLGLSGLLVGLVVFLPLAIVGSVIAKFVTLPLVPVFDSLDDSKADTNPVGKVCTITLSVKDGHVGQADVIIDGNTQRIYVVAKPGVELRTDETALVVQYNKSQSNYLIEPYSHS